MNWQNSLQIDTAPVDRCTPSPEKLVESDGITMLSSSETHNGRQYSPSETLQRNAGSEAPSGNKLRTLLGGFQLCRGPSLPRSNATIDLLVTFFCFGTVHYLYLGGLELTSHRTIALFSSLTFMILSLFSGAMYSRKKMRSLDNELRTLLFCWACTFAATGLLAFLIKTAEDVSRVWITASMMLTLLSLSGVRLLGSMEFIAGGRARARNIIVCGYAPNITPLMHNLKKTSSSRIRIGRVFELPARCSLDVQTSQALKSFSNDITEYIESQRQSGAAVEQVWIAVSTDQSHIVEQLSRMLFNSPVDVCVVPDSYSQRLLEGEAVTFGDSQVINISEISLSPAADQFKRIFDVTLSSIALTLLCIPMAIIAMLIKLESPGPALFRQKRYGVDGKEIEVLKFRSMVVHSDSLVRQATRNDTRITRLGKILRGTSLDELPQLLNVLGGSMSLIGPRPHAIAHNEVWRTQIDGYMLRHKVRPGITGLAQVNGWRGETDKAFKMRQRVKYDLEYIQHWSPWLDIRILFFTLFVGFSSKNAY